MILTSAQIGYSLLIIAGFLIGFILFLRNYFHRYSNQLASQKSNLSIQTKKYQEVNVFKYDLTNWLFGLACSISLAVLLFSYTKPEKKIDWDLCAYNYFDEMERDIPRTFYQAVIPPLPIIETLPEERIEENIEFSSIETDTTIIDSTIKQVKKIMIPIIKKGKGADFDKVYTKVEFMPTFPGCEDLSTEQERKKCTETKMLKFLHKNIKYSAIMNESCVQGPVVVSFIIDKDGSVVNTKLIKDIGAGYGAEGLRVVNLMKEMPKKWMPGYRKGKAVKIKYIIPIRIRER